MGCWIQNPWASFMHIVHAISTIDPRPITLQACSAGRELYVGCCGLLLLVVLYHSTAVKKAETAKLLKSAFLAVVMHMVHFVPVLVVGLDGVQHGLCRWDELDIAFEQR